MVDHAQIGGVNAYNHQIAVDRAKRCFRTFIDLTTNHLSRPKYDYAVLALGGDCPSGIIHDELRETNEFPIHVSVFSLAEHIAAGIIAMHNAPIFLEPPGKVFKSVSMLERAA